MGLDITAYRRLRAVADTDVPRDKHGEPDPWDGYLQVIEAVDWRGRAAGLVNDGWYAISHASGDQTGFRAGSYGGYNNWRESLAKLAGYPAVKDEDPRHTHSAGAWAADSGPFWELIHFTDCDGIIGPVVSAKLAGDFAEWDERAKALKTEDHPWFYRLYSEWSAAFEMAADGGAVEFH